MHNLLDASYVDLLSSIRELGESDFRAQQVWSWIWRKRCRRFEEMTNLSKDLRNRLAQSYTLRRPEVHTAQTSRDGTVKLLLELQDGVYIETVLIPERDHFTLCLSAQAGCALGCTFCSTGQMGLERNLRSGEILGQILAAQDYLQQQEHPFALRNLVFMGMGEPLLNWGEVKKSLAVIRDDQGLDFSYRRTTVSTVGVPDALEAFAASGLASLAVSLHAPRQGLRERIMPKAAALFPLDRLLSTLSSLPLRARQRITVEYVLLGGVNDSLREAKELNKAVSGLRCKINLIAFNPAPGLPYGAPEPEAVLAFERYLWSKDKTVLLRKSKGRDIEAACGQLRRRMRQTTTDDE
jgi:23S rRNA (adenine2503-C2)-methyltransferase